MAREIVVWCDPCMREEVRTVGSEVQVGIDSEPRILALCESHNAEFIKPLAALIDEFGASINGGASNARVGRQGASLASQQRKGRTPVAGRPNQCLWCPLSYSTGSGFSRHLKVEHGFNGLSEAFGGPCPVCGEGPYDTLGGHLVRSHPDLPTHPTAPFEWARDNGDPHGIYAATVQKKGSLNPDEAFKEVRSREASHPANIAAASRRKTAKK